jgi:hypothetical protein
VSKQKNTNTATREKAYLYPEMLSHAHTHKESRMRLTVEEKTLLADAIRKYVKKQQQDKKGQR